MRSSRRMQRSILLTVATLLVTGIAASAADQTIRGRLFLVRDPAPGGVPAPDKRVIKVKAKEPLSPNTIVGDPQVTGATLRIIANGASNYDETYPMPAAGWRTVNGFYRYDDFGNYGPVRIVKMRRGPIGKFVIEAVVLGKHGTVNVAPPNPGTDGGAIVTIVGGDSYCVGFGAAAGGAVTNVGLKRFKVADPTGEGCPQPGSPSGAFLDALG